MRQKLQRPYVIPECATSCDFSKIIHLHSHVQILPGTTARSPHTKGNVTLETKNTIFAPVINTRKETFPFCHLFGVFHFQNLKSEYHLQLCCSNMVSISIQRCCEPISFKDF